MKELIVKILIMVMPAGLFSQDLSGLRERVITASNDTIILDSLRIVPGTIVLQVFQEREEIHTAFYKTDPMNSLLILGSEFPYYGKELCIRYRVFTFDPDLSLGLKDTTIIIPYQREPGISDPHRYTYRPVSEEIWKEETLMRSGSISRGISFGNNQDVIVNSNLNLQLSGKLDDNLSIIASISDQNIPLQPEGYSRQIHEFDRIFIQVYNDDISITAGDFEVKGGGGIFLPLDKKAQGVQFSAAIEPGTGPFTGIGNTVSAAIAKGRYHRNTFTGIEGNQGPYKLKGANNELFIIVLAGTERVYIDGRIMERGVDRDYTIDYNLAEITFTSNMPVTRDRRIMVEFEYSDRNFARFMLSNTTSLSTARGDYFINVFSEHDARNQPLLQEINDEEKELLSLIGDNLDQAWVKKVDSVEFRNDMVLYEITDTLVDGALYSIYRYSVDPERAWYRPAFSYVGENKGNYIPGRSAANGRVFRWTAPVNGIPSGSHEPVTLLVTPKKQQVVNMGGRSSLTENTEASFEIALSNFDKNTFSGIDNDDNAGLAFRLGVDNNTPLGEEGHILGGGFDYEFSGRQFTSVERYRPVEHERDWNLNVTEEKSDEQKISWYARYQGRNEDYFRYRGEHLSHRSSYSGLRNILEAGTSAAGFNSGLMLSYLKSESDAIGTGFTRHLAEVSRPVWFFRLGIRSEGEDNRIEAKSIGILSATSFAFHQREVFLENPDTAKIHFFSSYRERTDKLPREGKLEHSSFAREFSAGFRSEVSPGNQFSGTLHHRRFKPDRGLTEQARPENSLNGRLEARIRLLNGTILSTGLYQTGSGLEAKKEFMYIEVSRGQGTHTWTDYNENGIKELDEFEPAVFADQANYIRIMIPTDDYIRTRSNQFSQSIRVTPPSSWQNGKGLTKLLSLFSGQTAFQTTQKTRNSDLLSGSNPFNLKLADTNLINVSASFRNTISFHTENRRFTLEYLNQNNRSRNLLVNGFDTREIRSDAITGRFEAAQAVNLTSLFETGKRSYGSEFFPGRDFDIESVSTRIGIAFQPGFALQTSLHIKFTKQENNPGREKAWKRNLGTELSYTIHSRGNIAVRADYFHIKYDARENTPLAWEMLEGLKPGNNMTLMVQWQQSLTGNLQLSLNYNGRTSGREKFIHTGGMQVRAYF